jgi:DNA repair exonuclease SbcCD ATPase subunit
MTPQLEQLRTHFHRLQGQRTALQRDHDAKAQRLAQLSEYLALAPSVDAALQTLSHELFGKIAETIEYHLTLALQEVLQQPITLKVERDFKRGAATMQFHIDRDGQTEDIMRAQGGSVANILSVGLRILALAMLDNKTHQRFLILDEQDCWLAPDLVPRLVKIVQQAAKDLHFQIILISHHSTGAFAPYADKILRLVPSSEGIRVEDATPRVAHPD